MCQHLGGREFDCDSGDSPLPPLCTDGPFGASTCVPAQSRYWFVVNGHVTTLVHEAMFRERSQFEIGVHDAGTDKLAGKRLQDRIDLDSFVLSSRFVCRTSNAPNCHDLGYYTEWMASARQLVVQYFDVDRDGSHATVSAAAGMPPQKVITEPISRSLMNASTVRGVGKQLCATMRDVRVWPSRGWLQLTTASS